MDDQTLIEKFRNYIEEHAGEMVEDILTLCRINSVKAEPCEGMPYGRGAYEALMQAKAICEGYGFAAKTYDNRVIAADLNGGDACLDILAHMDVVAPGDGWTKTEAFAPVVIGDAIYGRGTSDDKGPSMAALYAMRAVKELGIPLKGRCRLILGSDEESGSGDIPHYYAVEPEAPMTFSPDAEFPVTNIEKGQFRGTVTSYIGAKEGAADGTGASANASALPEKRLLRLESGDTINIVPGKGYALVTGFTREEIEPVLAKVRAEVETETGTDAGCSITLEPAENEADTLCIRVVGKAAHASLPESGINAALIILKVVSRLPFTNQKLSEQLKKLCELFPYGDFYGAGLGVDLKDSESGNTTLSADILTIDEEFITLKFDSRTCVIADEENTIEKAAETLIRHGFTFTYTFNPPHVVRGDSEFVKTLLEQYTLVTGNPGRCVAIGGGSYVHGFANGVTFGAVGETTDTHMHGADEFMLISELKQAVVVFAMSIVKLCGDSVIS